MKNKVFKQQQSILVFNMIFFNVISILVMVQLQVVSASSAAGTETLIGIVGRDFVMLGADSSVSQSISLTSSNLDKIAVIANPFPEAATIIEGSDGSSSKVNHDNHHGFALAAVTQQHGRRPRRSYSNEQQTILVAAAGDAADTDRMIAILTARTAIREYEASVGCDVDFVDLNSDQDFDAENGYNNGKIMSQPPGLSVHGIAHLARGEISKSLRSYSPFRVNLLVAGMMFDHDDIEYTHDANITPATDFSVKREDGELASEQLRQQIQMATTGTTTSTSSVNLQRPFGVVQQQQPEIVEKDNIKSYSDFGVLRPRLFWLDEYGSIQKLHYGAHGLGSNFVLSILDQGYNPNISREEATKLIHECFNQLRTRFVINSPEPPCIKCVDANGCKLIL